MFEGRIFQKARTNGLALALFALLGTIPASLHAQGWTWQTETVDKSGKFTSLAVDDDGNLHLSYADGYGSIKYGFRAAATAKWFSMTVDAGDAYTDLAIDHQGRPHLCYAFRVVKYASFSDSKWLIQPIAPGTGEVSFSCAVALLPDGTPIVSWYKTRNVDNSYYDHLKCAILQDDVWLVRTVDFDLQTGKWHSLTIDAQGVPRMSYDAFVKGDLRYAQWDGKKWQVQVVDARPRSGDVQNLGMGNSIVVDPQGQVEISYQDSMALKFAKSKGNRWMVETVDSATGLGSWVGWRTSLALDRQGFPHISYEDAGSLKHAYWDGHRWNTRVVAARGSDGYRYSSLAIDKQDNIYIAYRDPVDGSLKVAVGRPADQSRTAETEKKDKN